MNRDNDKPKQYQIDEHIDMVDDTILRERRKKKSPNKLIKRLARLVNSINIMYEALGTSYDTIELRKKLIKYRKYAHLHIKELSQLLRDISDDSEKRFEYNLPALANHRDKLLMSLKELDKLVGEKLKQYPEAIVKKKPDEEELLSSTPSTTNNNTSSSYSLSKSIGSYFSPNVIKRWTGGKHTLTPQQQQNIRSSISEKPIPTLHQELISPIDEDEEKESLMQQQKIQRLGDRVLRVLGEEELDDLIRQEYEAELKLAQSEIDSHKEILNLLSESSMQNTQKLQKIQQSIENSEDKSSKAVDDLKTASSFGVLSMALGGGLVGALVGGPIGAFAAYQGLTALGTGIAVGVGAGVIGGGTTGVGIKKIAHKASGAYSNTKRNVPSTTTIEQPKEEENESDKEEKDSINFR
mmetsp:Transcript_2986/g.4368  ORF Transcript_2986/g.4368 Transcript_2986/m.4368 type:complete len:410 (+) Transcript_2986:58-1287(+)|eukprot:CAMPEP_0117425764 /NCGR_PEP_ID=MMETSP0758-20121206/5999_1 /TAXON_ID=63605 /ORGANISM="Percolomonas cosmopolitus, Strain AE-1 (ATCC 50343)" /LENGTH=409 /DNA_ID=CAMNT_0005210501 /DNA_START=63 /DNA_END=1289 /DNA_ORIENTATION=+